MLKYNSGALWDLNSFFGSSIFVQISIICRWHLFIIKIAMCDTFDWVKMEQLNQSLEVQGWLFYDTPTQSYMALRVH